MKSAAWLEDEVGRIAFLTEFAGYAEDLPLALAPFAASVDEEEAQKGSCRPPPGTPAAPRRPSGTAPLYVRMAR